MLKHKNLVFLGTSHIAADSIKEIENAFAIEKPDIVAVELDPARLHALLTERKPNYSIRMAFTLGFKGYLFAVIGSLVQQKLGDIVGVKPGSDMLRAVELARDNGRRIALIDRDIQVTLARLSKAIGWREKFNFFIDLVLAPFSKKMRIDIGKVPEKELIKQLLGLLKKRYPGLHRVLVEERNKIMALKLKALIENYPDKKIMAVMGAGHEETVLEIIKAGQKRQ
jgi:pheromone shutdown-related protein TraB